MSKYKYELLLGAQLILAILSPLFSTTVFARLVLDAALSIVLATAMYVIADSRRTFLAGLALMVPALLLLWLGQLAAKDAIVLWSYGFIILFLGYIVSLILADIVRIRLVTLDVIAGGLSVYLLLGNLWGILYAMIGRLDPNAFIMPETMAGNAGIAILDTTTAMYFSFTTLTTLGFGDITPVSMLARTLAYLEAVIGQFYLAVLVASLVGMHIAHSTSQPERRKP